MRGRRRVQARLHAEPDLHAGAGVHPDRPLSRAHHDPSQRQRLFPAARDAGDEALRRRRLRLRPRRQAAPHRRQEPRAAARRRLSRVPVEPSSDTRSRRGATPTRRGCATRRRSTRASSTRRSTTSAGPACRPSSTRRPGAREMAIRFVTEQRDGPWLLSLNPFDPHAPFDPPPEYLERYDPASPAACRCSASRISSGRRRSPASTSRPKMADRSARPAGVIRAGRGAATTTAIASRPTRLRRTGSQGDLLRDDRAARRPASAGIIDALRGERASSTTRSSSTRATTARCSATTACSSRAAASSRAWCGCR